jgi:pheromone alpha factor receptor
VVINYASQIGASAIMLLVVLLITKESKRKSPIFFLNVISLILSTLRSLLQTLYWVGPFSESYAYFSGDFSAVPRSAYANSVAAVTLTLLLLMCVEGSLVLQTNVVTTTLSPIYRYPILMLSLIISLLAIGFRFALTIQNAKAILATQTAYGIFWLGSAALITETISIWFFCAVFVAKLGWTVWRRRMLGLRQWGPMQILSIMGGCTMIVPCESLEPFPAFASPAFPFSPPFFFFSFRVPPFSDFPSHLLPLANRDKNRLTRRSNLCNPRILPHTNLPRVRLAGTNPCRNPAPFILRLGRRLSVQLKPDA